MIRDKVGYKGLHQWINRNKPKPQDGMCQICHDRVIYDAACITGVYNREFSNWQYQCLRCHMELDGRLRTFNRVEPNKRLRGEKHWNWIIVNIYV